MESFKRLVFVFLASHALADFTLAVMIYRQVGILAISTGIMVLCCVFSFYLFTALREEEFRRRWLPGKFYRGPINGPVAFWFTFAVLALIHLLLTVAWASLVNW